MANLVGVWPKLFLLKKSCRFECQGDRPCSNRGLRSDTTNLGQASEWVRQRGSHRQPNSYLRLTGYLRPTARRRERRKKQPPTWLPPLSSFAARTQGHSRVALFESNFLLSVIETLSKCELSQDREKRTLGFNSLDDKRWGKFLLGRFVARRLTQVWTSWLLKGNLRERFDAR